MMCLFRQAEARAEFAERSVQKLQKEVDRLEGKSHKFHRFVTDLLYCLIEFIAKHLQIIFKCYITYNLTGGIHTHTLFQIVYLPVRVDSDYSSYYYTDH